MVYRSVFMCTTGQVYVSNDVSCNKIMKVYLYLHETFLSMFITLLQAAVPTREVWV